MNDGEGKTAGVIAPPPLLYLAGLALGFGADAVWPVTVVEGGAARTVLVVAGAVAGAAGSALAAWAIIGFFRAGTRPEPNVPTQALVEGGAHGWSRNPMYVGLALVHFGVAVGFANVWALALLAPVLAVVRFGVVAREERYMEARFGQAYVDYKARVRRWI